MKSQTNQILIQNQLPCSDQSHQSIFDWAQKLEVGETVALKQTYTQIHTEYFLSEVEAITDNGRRVYVKNYGTFWRTEKAVGKNCYHPKGQLTMIQPTDGVLQAAKAKKIFW